MSLLSEREAKILEELRNLRALRHHVLDSSLVATRQRAFEAAQHLDAATALYHEAILQLAIEEEDSWELAREKSEKLDCIERNYLEAYPIFLNAMRRIDFEIAEAKKAGIANVKSCKSG